MTSTPDTRAKLLELLLKLPSDKALFVVLMVLSVAALVSVPVAIAAQSGGDLSMDVWGAKIDYEAPTRPSPAHSPPPTPRLPPQQPRNDMDRRSEIRRGPQPLNMR